MKRGINLIFLSSLLLLLCACTTAQTVDGTAVSGVVVSSDPTEALEGSSYATTLFGRYGMEAAIELHDSRIHILDISKEIRIKFPLIWEVYSPIQIQRTAC